MAREDITRLLHELRDGDPRAQEELLPAVYAELRAIAHNRLSPAARDYVAPGTAMRTQGITPRSGLSHTRYARL
jgi:hypothetical protein